MVCSRDTPTKSLYNSRDYLRQRAAGNEKASNGHLNLHLRLSSASLSSDPTGLWIIEPEILLHPPDVTIDATKELRKLGTETPKDG